MGRGVGKERNMKRKKKEKKKREKKEIYKRIERNIFFITSFTLGRLLLPLHIYYIIYIAFFSQ